MVNNFKKCIWAFITIITAVPYATADVHSGLKEVIDNGDYKSAANMVQKMNVSGMYLPPNLSIKDAEFIYGVTKFKDYKWILSIAPYYEPTCKNDQHSECSPQFLDKYVESLCSGKTDYHVQACFDWMKSTTIDDWKKIDNSFCQNKETIKTCSLYVDQQPANIQYQILKELDKKNLLRFKGMVEVDSTIEESIPSKECLDNWDSKYKLLKYHIANFINSNSVVEFGGSCSGINKSNCYAVLNAPFFKEKNTYKYDDAFICPFNQTRNAVNSCLAKLDQVSKATQKACRNGLAKRKVKKKIKVSKLLEPFGSPISNIWNNLLSTPWYAMDEQWKEKVKFVQKYYKNKDLTYSIGTENGWVYGLTDFYAKSSDLDISYVKRACIVYPSIDNAMSKANGITLFSCRKILNEYPNYLNEPCEAKDSSWVKRLPLRLQNQRDSASLICDAKVGKFRFEDEFESITQEPCDKVDSSWLKTYVVDGKAVSIVCDKKIRGYRKATEVEHYTQGLCESPENSWIDRTNKIVCDKNTGWRQADEFEQIGGLCEDPKQSWIDTSKRVVCDETIGKFREANQFERIAGTLCEHPEKSWIDKTNSVICDKNVGWRDADEFEREGGLCENPEKSWIITDDDGKGKIVCDAKIGKFRKADKFEQIAGELCESPEKDWIKTSENSYGSKITFVCDKKLNHFRQAMDIEIFDGLCDDSRFGEEKYYAFTCTHDGWLDSKVANTAGIVFTKGKFAKGKINDKYVYFKNSQDDNIYRATKINGKIWMSENLQVQNRDFLNIREALQKCPDGWHLPDTTEWSALYKETGKNVSALMAKDLPDWPQATDKLRFSAIPKGFLDREAGKSALASGDVFFWTYAKNEKGEPGEAFIFHINRNNATIESERLYSRRSYNVRCIKNR